MAHVRSRSRLRDEDVCRTTAAFAEVSRSRNREFGRRCAIGPCRIGDGIWDIGRQIQQKEGRMRAPPRPGHGTDPFPEKQRHRERTHTHTYRMSSTPQYVRRIDAAHVLLSDGWVARNSTWQPIPSSPIAAYERTESATPANPPSSPHDLDSTSSSESEEDFPKTVRRRPNRRPLYGSRLGNRLNTFFIIFFN